MHAKSWIIDGKILWDGSCNLTHGGIENNYEHLLKITTPAVVKQARESFEALWDASEVVTQASIDRMNKIYEEKQEKSKSNRGGPSRSLTKELEGAAEDKPETEPSPL